MSEPQRCGTCIHWWHPKCISIGSILNGCGNAESEKFGCVTRDTEGDTCPCWARKESSDAE